MQNPLAIDLQESLNQLIGQECWSIIAGSGTGSKVHLDFGQRLRRGSRVSNQHLTEEQQVYEGEFILFIEDCTWRVDSSSVIICGSNDDSANNGPMVTGLKQLIGLSVERVECSCPAFDLALFFDNNFVLRLFCDQIDAILGADNYTFFLPGAFYTVGTRSKLLQEEN